MTFQLTSEPYVFLSWGTRAIYTEEWDTVDNTHTTERENKKVAYTHVCMQSLCKDIIKEVDKNDQDKHSIGCLLDRV